MKEEEEQPCDTPPTLLELDDPRSKYEKP